MDNQPPSTPPPTSTPEPPSAPQQPPESPQPPQSPTPQPPEKKSGGYGKRPLWQWILLYVIIGAIVYGLIYYFFMRGSAGTGY